MKKDNANKEKKISKYNKKIFGYDVDIQKVFIYSVLYIAVIAILLVADRLWIDVSWYGVLVGSGFIIGLGLFTITSKIRNINDEFPFSLILWVFPMAIIGARLYYILFRLENYKTFYDWIAVWNGGLAIYGGVIAGIIAVAIACAVHKQNFLDSLDTLAPCLILGQAIGRWGNFINQEAYGFEITNKAWQFFPFAVYIEESGQWHLATFFIESMWCLVGCVILLIILAKVKQRGICLCSYGIVYGLERLIVEGFRTDSLYMNLFGSNVRVSQLLSGIILVVSIIALITIIILNRKKIDEKKESV